MSDLSYSMINDIKNERKPYRKIETRKIYKWVDDSVVSNCYKCKIGFGLFYRKHHCRMCGRIFCYTCSSGRIDVPIELQIKPPSNNNYILNDYLSDRDNKKVRVCDHCFTKMTELNKLKALIMIFDIMNFTIPELLVLRCVNKQWQQVANYFLSRIREMQYYLSDHKYSEFDKKVLWKNRYYIMGHSQWMIQLLKSIDYEDYKSTTEKLDGIKNLITDYSNNKILNCRQLMCTRQCKEKLMAEDCLNLLNKSIKSQIIKKYAISYLESANITELTCYIPFFVHHMKYESIENSVIGEYLINKCITYANPINNRIDSKSIIFINEFYWQMRLGLEDDNFSQIYKYFLDKFDNEINKNIVNWIKCGHNLINLLKNIPKDLSESDIKTYIKKNAIKINQLSIPTNPIINNIEINISDIHVKNSATKPIQIPLRYKLNNTYHDYNFLYKSEDVRKDKIILNIIKLIDLILKKEEKLDLDILTYGIRPIDKNSGIIEFIPNCDTIYHIKEKMNFSILNYMMENNKGDTIHNVRKRFLKSCAAYCVITYLLGIGDRHLENIMITKSGILFHIDYSYILGFDAKPFVPQMRITSDMVDALGGVNSEYYKEFKNTCNIVYNCLRRHINLFINMLSLLGEIDPPINNKYPFTTELIKNEILKRFIPGENNEQAELQLYNQIDRSSSDYKYWIADLLHYGNQETAIGGTIHTAKNLLYNVYSSIFYN